MSEIRVSPTGRTAVAQKTRAKKSATPSKRSPSRQPAAAPMPKMSDEDHLLFASMPALAQPGIDQKILSDLLKKLEVDLFSNQLTSETSTIKADQTRTQNLIKQNQKKLSDMIKKIEQQAHASLISKIFSWIGAALGVILGAVLAVVSFGTGSIAAGAFITASVTLAVTLTILSATGGMEKMIKGLSKPLEDMLEAFGVDAKKAKQIAEITTQVVVAVIIIAVQIALAIGSGGANITASASETINKIASIAAKTTNFAIAIDGMASAGASTASGAYRYQALEDQADMLDTKAILKKIEAIINAEQGMIKDILNLLTGAQKKIGALIKDENQNRDIISDIDSQRSAV